MGIDTPGPPDGGDGPEGPRRPGARDRPPGESTLAIETRQPIGSRAAHRAELAAASDQRPDRQPENRADAIREIITDEHGNYLGIEGRRKKIKEVSRDELGAMIDEIRRRFGPPDLTGEKPDGTYEAWWITDDHESNVTYRTFSDSGGETIDLNRVPGIDGVRRFHLIRDDDQRTS